MNDLKTKSKQFLSKGSYGTVYCDKDKKNVSKYIYIYDESMIYIENNIKELLFHCLITFNYFEKVPPSLPRMKSLVFKDNYCVINMPYYGIAFNNIKFSELSIKYIFDLIDSLNFLHLHNFSHGDLKPSNILIKKEQLYLIDYGSICFKHSIKYNSFNQRCTIYYVSPEECKYEKYFISTDIWSLGCIIFEHITKKRFIEILFKKIKYNYDEFETLTLSTKEYKRPYKILDIIYTEISQELINDLIDKYVYCNNKETQYYYYNLIIKKCLQLDKDKRITAFELIKLPIFNKYDSYTINSNININKFSQQILYINKDTSLFLNTIYNSILYLKSINKIDKIDIKIEDKNIEKLAKILTYIILMNSSIKEEKNLTYNIKKFFTYIPYLLSIINSKDIF
jgi:serine/threonine protein kinase